MSDQRKKPQDLRSQQWFGRQDRDGFAYRSWVKGKGVPHDQFDGRPVIGICNTFSELNPCNSHFRTLAEQVKIGVYEAGGFPLEFPVMSLGEVLMRPTAMLYRNLASMDVEESIRGNPVDGVVLLVGCDKTTPSLLMGAASCDLPTIGVSGGPMLSGKWRGQELGSGTGVWQMSEQVRAGTLRLQDFLEAESCMHRSHGHCMTMGTASTMASMVEALGVGLPGNAAYPAVDGRRNVIARHAGRRCAGRQFHRHLVAHMLVVAQVVQAPERDAADPRPWQVECLLFHRSLLHGREAELSVQADAQRRPRVCPCQRGAPLNLALGASGSPGTMASCSCT